MSGSLAEYTFKDLTMARGTLRLRHEKVNNDLISNSYSLSGRVCLYCRCSQIKISEVI